MLKKAITYINKNSYNGVGKRIVMIKLTEEEKETLSYDDVAYLIIKEEKKQIKIQELFKKVIEAMGLDESVFENNIGEFFELIITDKRFTMLDDGYVDLKINHSTKMIVEEDEEEEILLDNDEEIIEEDDEENYDDESNPEDDNDNDLQDLVIIDEDNDELESDML